MLLKLYQQKLKVSFLRVVLPLEKQFSNLTRVISLYPGTVTEKECDDLVKKHKIPNYLWRNGTTCDGRKDILIKGGFEVHKFKPCCYGNEGITNTKLCYSFA